MRKVHELIKMMQIMFSKLTGDVGYYDEFGYIYVIDKISDVIKCRGEVVRCLNLIIKFF